MGEPIKQYLLCTKEELLDILHGLDSTISKHQNYELMDKVKQAIGRIEEYFE
jgi:hypothetical protein